jgi:hypothetical protein
MKLLKFSFTDGFYNIRIMRIVIIYDSKCAFRHNFYTI